MSRMLPVNPGRGRRRHDLLFDLLAAMDTHVMPQAPVDPSAWVALLAAPLVARQWQALVRRRQSAASKASRWASEEGGSDGSSNSTEELQESDAEAAILHGGMSRQLWDVEEEDTESTSYGSKQQQAEDDNGPLGPGSSSSGRDSESEDAGGDSTSSDSDSEGPRSDEEAGSRAAARAAALEAYAEVIEATMELLLQPLDASMCARLELDPAQLLALRPPSRGQVAVQAQIEQLAAVGDDAVAVVALEDTLCTGSDGDAAVSTAAAIDSLPPHAAIISSILPRAAVDKAAALLLAEAELRGRELPWELPPNGASSSRQQLHHRGHRRARKPTVEEKLVLSILRDPRLGYGQLTSLAALQAAVKDGK